MMRKWALKLLKLDSLSIYTKLLFAFLLVTTPVVLMSLEINRSSERLVSDQIGLAMNSKVHYLLSAIDDEIVRINNFKYEFVNDSNLQILSKIPEAYDFFGKQEALINLNEKMRFFTSSSPYIERVKIYMPRLGRSIFSDKVLAYISEEEINAIRSPRKAVYPITHWEEKLIIGEFYPLLSKNDDNYAFVLEVELSQRALANSLQNINLRSQTGAFLFDYNQDWVITDGKNDALQLQLLNQIKSDKYRTNAPNLLTLTVNREEYLVAREESPKTGMTLVVYEPVVQFLQPIKQHRTYYWIILCGSLLVILTFSYWVRRMIHRPIQQLVTAFNSVERENWNISLHRQQRDEFQYLYNKFNAMVSRIRSLIVEVYDQKIRMQQSELKQLQSQINPHFLYNSYYAIYRLAEKEDVEKIVKYTRYLGDYFQFITRNGSNEIPLDMELKHARAYVEIQMLRYAERISTTIGPISAQASNIMVPRLILQPIIENAYEHGLRDKQNGGIVEITFNIELNRITITVDDNGEGLSDNQLEELQRSLQMTDLPETTGLINIHRRLANHFSSPSKLEFERSHLGGLRVIMTIVPSPLSEADRQSHSSVLPE
jgi:two-component system sensor histidine kinase YesM